MTINILRVETRTDSEYSMVCINKKVHVGCSPSFDLEAMEAAGDDNPLKYGTGEEVKVSSCDCVK